MNQYPSAQHLASWSGLCPGNHAIIAVADTILVIVFHMRKCPQPYHDLGADYFDRRNSEQLKRSLLSQTRGPLL